MTDQPKTPQLIPDDRIDGADSAVVETSELPVEVETEYGLKFWHDGRGAWVDAFQSGGPEFDHVLVDPTGECVDVLDAPDGTLRICELVTVADRDAPDFDPTEPGDSVDWGGVLERAAATAWELERQEELNRHEREKLERMRRRVELLGGDDE